MGCEVMGIFLSDPIKFFGGAYYRQGNRIVISGKGIPTGILAKLETMRMEPTGGHSFEVEGWSNEVVYSTPIMEENRESVFVKIQDTHNSISEYTYTFPVSGNYECDGMRISGAAGTQIKGKFKSIKRIGQ
jgi:hypothetical protein